MSTDHQLKPAPTPPPPRGGAPAPKLDLSIPKIVGGALAAMTTAALASRLGVAGTLVGAAAASVIAAVATAVYTASISHTRDRVRTVLTSRNGATAVQSPDSGAVSAVDPAPVGPSTRRRLNWISVAVGAIVAFVIALAAVTGIELASGQALSGGSGTTVRQLAEPSGSKAPTTKPTPIKPSVTKPTTSNEPQIKPSATLSSAQPTDQPKSSEPSTTEPSAPAPSATSVPSASAPTSAPAAATPSAR